MSRIIIERHKNGEEQLVTGWDNPLQTAFVDLYDADGEIMGTYGPLSGDRVSPGDAVEYLVACDVPLLVASKVGTLLYRHRELEYPESNVVVDLT